jgi:hypothetical protein
MKQDFEKRKENRIQYAKNKSASNLKKATRLHKEADQIANATQGEPIHIGHHSEKRHRRDLDRMHNSIRGAFEATDKAAYYEAKAKTIEENTSISSDDPNAIEKISERLATFVSLQEFMKAANKCIKRKDKAGFLKLEYGSERLWNSLNTPDPCDGLGFPHYKLTNNSANIRRLKTRLQELVKASTRVRKERVIKGVTVIENVEANRIQLIFPGKPSEEARKNLKYNFGFIWCGSEGAWQRFLNNAGISAANRFLETYQVESSQ